MSRKNLMKVVCPWTIVAASAVTMGSPVLVVALVWVGVSVGLMLAVK